MKAVFYSFKKQLNSTKRPQDEGDEYDITLKHDCSLLKPVISLIWSGVSAETPVAYNYIRIPAFNRFYWVNNWTYSERQWLCSCEVDVLGSWYLEIGNQYLYITRSSVKWNEDILDNKYPAKADVRTSAMPVILPWSYTGENGRFILGVSGLGNTYSVGGCGYVVTDVAGLQNILNACFNQPGVLWPSAFSLDAIGTALAEFGNCLQRSIQNPFQFINSCTWVPFIPSVGSPFHLALGTFNTGVSVYPLAAPNVTHTVDVLAPVLLPGEMKWRYVEPFCCYDLFLPPFGLVRLDSEKLEFRTAVSGTETNRIQIITDCITGSGILKVFGSTKSTFRALAAYATGQVGIPVSLTGQNVDTMAFLQSTLKAAAATAGAVSTGIGVDAAFNSIGDSLRASSPQAIGVGGGGGFAAYEQARVIYETMYIPVDENLYEYGRPFCEYDFVRNHPEGFIQAAVDKVSGIPATEPELEELGKYMERGFYYEY